MERCHGFGAAIVTGDDLLEGVEQEILPLWVRLDLRQDEWKVLLQVASTDTPCKKRRNSEPLFHAQDIERSVDPRPTFNTI